MGDFDFIISLLDWEKNIDPNFFQARFMPPIRIRGEQRRTAGEVGRLPLDRLQCQGAYAWRLALRPLSGTPPPTVAS